MKSPKSSHHSSAVGSEKASFYVVTFKENRSFRQENPFFLAKDLTKQVGEVKGLSKPSNGTLLVEVASGKQAKKLLDLKQLVKRDVEVKPHATLNSCRGVISCRDFDGLPDDMLTTEMAQCGVKSVRRIMSRRDGLLKPTTSFIVTFEGRKLPEKIRVAYLSITVRPYIPNPLRCFRCQRFGHTKFVCKSKTAICPNCGQAEHESCPCPNTAKCCNCKGAHSAQSRDCPKWIEEKKIQEVRVTRNISFPEARALVVPRSSILSFAEVVKAKPLTRSIGCMTDAAVQHPLTPAEVAIPARVLRTPPRKITSPKAAGTPSPMDTTASTKRLADHSPTFKGGPSMKIQALGRSPAGSDDDELEVGVSDAESASVISGEYITQLSRRPKSRHKDKPPPKT